MGVYWIYANDTKREWLDPDALGDNNKWPVHRSGMALFWLLKGRWRGDSIRAVSDYGDEYFWILGKYTPAGVPDPTYPYANVTSIVVKEALLDGAAICVEAVRPAGRDEEAEAPTWLVRLVQPVYDINDPEQGCRTDRTFDVGAELVVWCYDLQQAGDCAIVERNHVLL